MSAIVPAGRYWIELDLAGEQLRGQLHHADRRTIEFTGWLGLVALIDQARSEPEPAEDQAALG